MKTTDDKWEWLSYTYELPWKPDASGESTSNISRVKIGLMLSPLGKMVILEILVVRVGDFSLNQQDIATIFKFTALIQACISKAVSYPFISTHFLVTRFKKAIFA